MNENSDKQDSCNRTQQDRVDSDQRTGSRTRTRRQVVLTTGAVGIAGLLAGCGGGGPAVTTTSTPTDGSMDTTEPGMGTESPTETETPTETESDSDSMDDPRVRVAHLSPNAPNVDVYVDDAVALEDVPFGAVSDYLALAPGSHAVEITAAGDADTSVFQGDVTVESGTFYTVAAIGELGDDVNQPFQPLVLTDNNEVPASDTARLRAVHASPDAPAVDITAGDTVLFDGVEFGQSGYVEVPSGDYTVQFRGDTENNDGDVAASFDVSLAGGTVYSAFAVGYLDTEGDGEDEPFDLVVTEDVSAG